MPPGLLVNLPHLAVTVEAGTEKGRFEDSKSVAVAQTTEIVLSKTSKSKSTSTPKVALQHSKASESFNEDLRQHPALLLVPLYQMDPLYPVCHHSRQEHKIHSVENKESSSKTSKISIPFPAPHATFKGTSCHALMSGC